MPIRSAVVINGKINAPGDRDLFELQMSKGEILIAEVFARRLNSPLDSILMVTDASGKMVAHNDDYEDISLGRMTHHADARIPFKAPESGSYIIHLGDSQNGGSPDHA